MKRIRVHVSGIVQGVCFRAATRRAAADLNLTGWVRNTRDGRVEAIFEGDDAAVEKMVEWCQVGPPAARVDKVILMEEQYTGGLAGFNIKF
ncbi:MAG: acylphosphatase [Syntrophaceae bacterium]|nr:acylphosphatase [Syntrophaceae bacterium]